MTLWPAASAQPRLVEQARIGRLGRREVVAGRRQALGLGDREQAFAFDVAAQRQRARGPPDPRRKRSGERAFSGSRKAADGDEARRGGAQERLGEDEVMARQRAFGVALGAGEMGDVRRFDLGADRCAQAHEEGQGGEPVELRPSGRARGRSPADGWPRRADPRSHRSISVKARS